MRVVPDDEGALLSMECVLRNTSDELLHLCTPQTLATVSALAAMCGNLLDGNCDKKTRARATRALRILALFERMIGSTYLLRRVIDPKETSSRNHVAAPPLVACEIDPHVIEEAIDMLIKGDRAVCVLHSLRKTLGKLQEWLLLVPTYSDRALRVKDAVDALICVLSYAEEMLELM